MSSDGDFGGGWSDSERANELVDAASAIAVMTAWSDDQGNEFAEEVIEGIVGGDVGQLAHLTAGLVSLSGMLLQRAADEAGLTPHQVLRELAAGIA